MYRPVPERTHLAQIETLHRAAAHRCVFKPSARNFDQTQIQQLCSVMTRHAVSDRPTTDILKRHKLRLSQFANRIRNFAHCNKPFQLIQHNNHTRWNKQELYQMFQFEHLFEIQRDNLGRDHRAEAMPPDRASRG